MVAIVKRTRRGLHTSSLHRKPEALEGEVARGNKAEVGEGRSEATVKEKRAKISQKSHKTRRSEEVRSSDNKVAKTAIEAEKKMQRQPPPRRQSRKSPRQRDTVENEQCIGRNLRNRNIFDDFADLDFNAASILESAVKVTQIVRLAENGSPTPSSMTQFEDVFNQAHPHILKIMRRVDDAYTLFRPTPVPSPELLAETAREISILCDVSMAEKLNRYKLSHQGELPKSWWDLNTAINVHYALERNNLEHLKRIELSGHLDGFSELVKEREGLYLFHSDSGFSYLFGDDLLLRLPSWSISFAANTRQANRSETEESVPEENLS